jgi:arylsulfatase A-like enzyme
MRHPLGKGAGRTSNYFASPHDIGSTVLSVLGAQRPKGMNGVDLSPLFDGNPPRTKRQFRTACYGDYVSASDGRWLLISGDRKQDLRLYDRARDRRERVNIARRDPPKVRQLWGAILRDAGGHLPRFTRTRAIG